MGLIVNHMSTSTSSSEAFAAIFGVEAQNTQGVALSVVNVSSAAHFASPKSTE